MSAEDKYRYFTNQKIKEEIIRDIGGSKPILTDNRFSLYNKVNIGEFNEYKDVLGELLPDANFRGVTNEVVTEINASDLMQNTPQIISNLSKMLMARIDRNIDMEDLLTEEELKNMTSTEVVTYLEQLIKKNNAMVQGIAIPYIELIKDIIKKTGDYHKQQRMANKAIADNLANELKLRLDDSKYFPNASKDDNIQSLSRVISQQTKMFDNVDNLTLDELREKLHKIQEEINNQEQIPDEIPPIVYDDPAIGLTEQQMVTPEDWQETFVEQEYDLDVLQQEYQEVQEQLNSLERYAEELGLSGEKELKEKLDKFMKLENLRREKETYLSELEPQVVSNLKTAKIKDIKADIEKHLIGTDIDENVAQEVSKSRARADKIYQYLLVRSNDFDRGLLATLLEIAKRSKEDIEAIAKKEYKTNYTVEDFYFKNEVDKMLRTLTRKGVENPSDFLYNVAKNLEHSEVAKKVLNNKETEEFSLDYTILDKKNAVASELIKNSMTVEFLGDSVKIRNKTKTIDEASLQNRKIVKQYNKVKKKDLAGLFNYYMLFEKSARGELAKEEFEEAKKVLKVDRSIDNTLKQKIFSEVEDIRKIGVEVKKKEKVGALNRKEVSDNIIADNFFEAGESIVARFKEGDKPKDWFMRKMHLLNGANVAYSKLGNCLEKAKNPTNDVETSASMSRDCLEKAKQELAEMQQKVNQALKEAGFFGGINPFYALLVFSSIYAYAEELNTEKRIGDTIKKISKEISYIQRAEDDDTFMVRKSIIDIDSRGIGDLVVSKEIADEMKNELESSSLSFELIENKKALKDIDTKEINILEVLNRKQQLLKEQVNHLSITGREKDTIKEELDKLRLLELAYIKEQLKDPKVQENTFKQVIREKLSLFLRDDSNKKQKIDEVINSIDLKDNDSILRSLFSTKVVNDLTRVDRNLLFASIKETQEAIRLLNRGKTNSNIEQSEEMELLNNYIKSATKYNKGLQVKVSQFSWTFEKENLGDKAYILGGKDIDGYLISEIKKYRTKLLKNGTLNDEEMREFNKLIEINEKNSVLSSQAKKWIAETKKDIAFINQKSENINRSNLKEKKQYKIRR